MMMREMLDRDKIMSLRSMIPEMNCIEGCTDCCGVIFFSDWEWRQVTDKRVADGLTCPYVNSQSQCDIYKDRPIMCRLFGSVKTGVYRCFHECTPEIPLTEEELFDIMNRWMEVVSG